MPGRTRFVTPPCPRSATGTQDRLAVAASRSARLALPSGKNCESWRVASSHPSPRPPPFASWGTRTWPRSGPYRRRVWLARGARHGRRIQGMPPRPSCRAGVGRFLPCYRIKRRGGANVTRGGRAAARRTRVAPVPGLCYHPAASCRTLRAPERGGRTTPLMARIIAVANQKGGVGKTTTTANLGASLTLLDRRVLLVDMDPQGNLTAAYGLEKQAERTIADALLDRECPLPIVAVNQQTHAGLDLVPSAIPLAGAEAALMNKL